MNEEMLSAVDRQKEVYLNGLRGQRPLLDTRYEPLRTAARLRLPSAAFDYIDGGAGNDDTVHENRRALDQWRIVPQMMRDVSQRDLGISLLGRSYKTPFFLCPIGVLEMAHPQADLAVARAAAWAGIPFIFSNQASVAMEETAAAMSAAPRMFQLYWSKSDALVESLVNRAAACGCDAIVVTLDTTLLGWRARDLQQAFLPFLEAMGIAQYTSDPVFKTMVETPSEEEELSSGRPTLALLRAFWRMSRRFPGGTGDNLRTRKPLQYVRKFINVYSRTTLQWSDLGWLRKRTALPIVVKGVLHPADARRAIDAGADAIYVSNHGGRQVGGSIGAIQALAHIAPEVSGEVPILFDSGIRGGADAFKALALGATAVGIGRPYVYALALEGEQGVKELLTNYVAELELTMALSGCASLPDVTRDLLVTR